MVRAGRRGSPPAVEGIARSLGEPDVSIVALSGPNPDVVITFSWEISWYQYRIARDSPQPVRLVERGLEPDELEPKFRAWNARLENGMGVLPEIDTGE